MTKVAVVTTTINKPDFLESYFNNTDKSVEYIVIGDNKTPGIVSFFSGIDYWNMARQTEWIRDTYPTQFDDVRLAIPENSVRRRNLGYLIALEQGADVIITVDDDNYQETGWLEAHLKGLGGSQYIASSINRLVNPCSFLEFDTRSKVYMRGYPMTQMFADETYITTHDTNDVIVLNMGLWRRAPDVDAATNLVYPDLHSLGFNKQLEECSYVVKHNNYIPINTQNTAFKRKVAPAFYTLLMDTNINGLWIDRYDDIWAGWILQKIANHLGDYVSFGLPLSDHIRNKHDYVRDFSYEYVGMILNARFFNFIDNLELNEKTYADCYREVADALLKSRWGFQVGRHGITTFIERLCSAMHIWLDLCEVVM